jgi:hypothetical protein
MSEDPKPVAPLPVTVRRRFATPADAWRWLKMPGMELVAPAPPRPRLVGNFCQCGKPISANKDYCLSCSQQIQLLRLAACIKTPAMLDEFLEQFEPAERAGVREQIRPWLTMREPAQGDAVGELR